MTCFFHRISRVLTIDASVPAASRVAGFDGRQHTLKHSKVLVEAIAGRVKPVKFRPKKGKGDAIRSRYP